MRLLFIIETYCVIGIALLLIAELIALRKDSILATAGRNLEFWLFVLLSLFIRLEDNEQ